MGLEGAPLDKLRQSVERLRRRRALASIRANLEFFGHDVSGLSDDELEAEVLKIQERFAKAWQAAALTCDQLAAACVEFGRAVAKAEAADLEARDQ